MNLNFLSVERRGLHLALSLAGSTDCRISRSVLTDHFGEEAEWLISKGLLAAEGHVTSIATEDDASVAVEWSSRLDCYGYFSETDGWVSIANDQLTMFSLQISPLIRQLTTQMDLSPSNNLTELAQGLIWELGTCRLPGRPKRVSVWAARRLNDPAVRNRIEQLRKDRPTPDVRLVLYLAEGEDPGLPFIANLSIMAVGSVVSVANPLEIDPDIVAARLLNKLDSPADLPVSADGGHVRVNGKEYVFSGSKQRAIIRILYVAKFRGELRSSTIQVLDEAGSSESTRRLARAFKGHKDWHEIIKEEGGSCWLDI